MCDWESSASQARIPREKSFTPATLLDSGALVCNVAEALPSTSLSWIQSNWGNISSLLLGRDPGDGVAANVSHILSQSHGTGATSINLAVRWINVESTHSHMVILAWAPNCVARWEFLNKALLFTFHGYFFPLCFGSAALCIHYRTNTELYLLGTTQRSAAWREAVRTTTKKRGWAENWSGQLRDGRHRWWQQGSQQRVHLWDAQYCTRLKAQSAVRLKCLLHIAAYKWSAQMLITHCWLTQLGKKKKKRSKSN